MNKYAMIIGHLSLRTIFVCFINMLHTIFFALQLLHVYAKRERPSAQTTPVNTCSTGRRSLGNENVREKNDYLLRASKT